MCLVGNETWAIPGGQFVANDVVESVRMFGKCVQIICICMSIKLDAMHARTMTIISVTTHDHLLLLASAN